MHSSTFYSQHDSVVIARLRAAVGATQAALAKTAGLDQSRVSRVEKGEAASANEIERLLDALEKMGSSNAALYKAFRVREWEHVEPPSFWNPQRAYLEQAEETVGAVSSFLLDNTHPWPLRRQIERRRDDLLRAATFLSRENHNIAFVGDIGVGKSTALSVLFDLLVPGQSSNALTRVVLETGAGGTTICEVHIKSGPEFGICALPLGDAELHQQVADLCTARWMAIEQTGSSADTLVSRETDRAIRNMSGLVRRKKVVDGKTVTTDPLSDLARECSSEDEFRTRVLELMHLPERTQREIWYDSSTRKNPMEWMAECFTRVNNGRVQQMSLPKAIDLIVPNFSRMFGELDITVIDTKGVDDVAVRPDLDQRLRDPRTTVVFCSRFNDAPGISARALLQHMRQTFSERVDTGKVSILALPRSGEARAMKDDLGDQAPTDSDGYSLKQDQVSAELYADDLGGVPMLFFNVESDAAEPVRDAIFEQLNRMRKTAADRMFDLCASIEDLIENSEVQALNAAIEEVANKLNNFLQGNRRIGARERLAHVEAISTIRGVRYASTLWAATRRSGEYSGLNIVHQVGVGAARDARLRSESWFASMDAYLNALKADKGLSLAQKTIDQIGKMTVAAKPNFLDHVQRAAMEVYRSPLSQSAVWGKCASEWGQGAGFKHRVVDHLEKWFASNQAEKDRLEEIVNALWEKIVITPLLRLSEESSPKEETDVKAA